MLETAGKSRFLIMRVIMLTLVLLLGVGACDNPNSRPYEHMSSGHGGGGGNR